MDKGWLVDGWHVSAFTVRKRCRLLELRRKLLRIRFIAPDHVSEVLPCKTCQSQKKKRESNPIRKPGLRILLFTAFVSWSSKDYGSRFINFSEKLAWKSLTPGTSLGMRWRKFVQQAKCRIPAARRSLPWQACRTQSHRGRAVFPRISKTLFGIFLY